MRTGSRIPLRLVPAVVVAVALGVATAGPSAAQESDEPQVRTLRVAWVDPEEVRLPLVEDRLDPATVLEIRAVGFPTDTTGNVRHCVTETTRVCRNALAVRTDDDGVAVFQYLITDTVDSVGACRISSPRRCTLEIAIGDRRTEIDTVFVDQAPPPGLISVDPRRGLSIGDTVTVELVGFPAGAELTVQVCAVPSTRGDRCGPPGPEVRVITDGDGSARTRLTLDVNDVGDAGIACGRRTTCQVVTTGDGVGARAAPAPLHFATTPGASYDGPRLAAGLLLAALLCTVAIRLTRGTDWRPPAEADASAIDDAMWADLDAEAEAFEEEPAR